MILYEYPFNERIRTYLRLEHLFLRLGELVSRDSALDHHFALVTLFDTLDVSGRAELKSDLLKELERQKNALLAFRGNPAISESTLDGVVSRLEDVHGRLNQQSGKIGHGLLDNEWLMGVRSRAVIPAGTCSFDLPAYHAWQQHPAAERRQDLLGWIQRFEPAADAVRLLLQMLRESCKMQMVAATGGQFQQNLPAGRTFQLLRLRIKSSLGLIPEISGNRLVTSVRLMRQDEAGKLQAAREDATFELGLCA
ncbi:MAG: cell division protein ZapD [Burkholderiaceae bacterium]|nr:cell division protein ZapD [Burkholderiaceae bacterium]